VASNDEIEKQALFDYETVAARRIATDSMMWQVPALTLTAQSFLLTIALDSTATRGAQVLSSVLALSTSFASMQLMARHRFFERQDSQTLERIELNRLSVEMRPLHAKHVPPTGLCLWTRIVSLKSYYVWQIVLAAFGCAALLILCCPGLFAATGGSES
jgi:hypothetical protein